MLKYVVVLFLVITTSALGQTEPKETNTKSQDSLKKRAFIESIGTGYYPTKYFNFDLRYLIKFNQFEGFRTGLGGITNENFSEKYRITGYGVYGFKDKRSKFSLGGGFRVSQSTNTWINLSYTDDLQETGSSTFLTDKRFFSFFEPRLLNINLFHRHITKSISVEHKATKHLLTEVQLATSKINPTYTYSFLNNSTTFNSFAISMARLSLQWSPFSQYTFVDKRLVETLDGYPKFTFQFTQSLANVFGSDFNFSKLDFRTIYEIKHNNTALTRLTMVAGVATGDTPLTHLYHAYPNNITKETILQRFSVAGINSFETMYFNEFFSDRFSTLQIKHLLKPFKISERFTPQMVLISRFALGNMRSIDKHQGITFNTLDQLYSESGVEINRLLFGFGLSFAYRYGGYHLPNFEDNIALKFTFNIEL